MLLQKWKDKWQKIFANHIYPEEIKNPENSVIRKHMALFPHKWAKDLHRPFLQVDRWMTNKHIKRCLTLLAILKTNENHRKILLWTHGMTKTLPSVGKDGGAKKSPSRCWWKCQAYNNFGKTVKQFVKLNIHPLYNAAIPLPDAREKRKHLPYTNLHAHIHSCFIYNTAQTGNNSNVPSWQVNRYIKGETSTQWNTSQQ